jgi:hypothetical protein
LLLTLTFETKQPSKGYSMSTPVDSNMAQAEGKYEERPNADGMASSHYFQSLFKQKRDHTLC